MTTQPPIIPPPELVQQWVDLLPQGSMKAFTAAAQWGADQEIEACLANIHTMYGKDKADWLRSMRRPKPPSLKKQAYAAQPAPVATDAEIREYAGERFPMCLRGAYNLGRQHGAPQPAPPSAPAGGLVERVAEAIVNNMVVSDLAAASAAIREVAAWIRENEDGYNAVRWLELEASR